MRYISQIGVSSLCHLFCDNSIRISLLAGLLFSYTFFFKFMVIKNCEDKYTYLFRHKGAEDYKCKNDHLLSSSRFLVVFFNSHLRPM